MRVVEKAEIQSLQPLLCSIEAAMAMTGRGQTFIIDAIATGRLRGVKSDRRTLVVVQSIHDYVNSLPPAKIKPDNRERRRMRAAAVVAA